MSTYFTCNLTHETTILIKNYLYKIQYMNCTQLLEKKHIEFLERSLHNTYKSMTSNEYVKFYRVKTTIRKVGKNMNLSCASRS